MIVAAGAGEPTGPAATPPAEGTGAPAGDLPIVELSGGARRWLGVPGRAVGRSVAFASPGGHRRRVERFTAHGIPRPHVSPATAAHAVLDELVLGGFNALRGAMSPDEFLRVEREASDAAAQFTERGWAADPLSYHEDPPVPGPVALGSRKVGRTRYEALRFDSGWEPHGDEIGRGRWAGYGTNERVRVLLLRHRDGPRSWVVCVHGAEMGGRPLLDTRILRAEHLHRRLGLNVAMPVLPLHGPRRPPSGATFPGLDLVDTVHGLAQSAWDVRRLLAWIRTTQEPSGVGLTGFSLGGYVGGLVAGLDPPLDVLVAGCPAVDLPAMLRRHSPREARDNERFAALLAHADVVLRPVSPLAFAARTPADRLYVYGGTMDRLAHPVEQAGSLARHWGHPNVLWFPGGHVSVALDRSVPAFVDRALRAHLDH